MRVCLDTNVLVSIFVPHPPYALILDALLEGRIALLISNEMLLEYEEVVVREFGSARWNKIDRLFSAVSRLHGNVIEVHPQFRFGVVQEDPDDNKFSDCAIAGEADFVVTKDAHFAALIESGYKPQPVTAHEFVARLDS